MRMISVLPTPDASPSKGGGQPRRRGACPGLSSPMPTGDGLLVRLQAADTVSLDAFAALCNAARTYGNGIMEVTARGSIQVRGLSAESAPHFAEAVAALDIAAADGVAVVSNALAGLDPQEILDASLLARDLRRALTQTAVAERLAAKVSVVIDGGGALGLDAVAADIRMRAQSVDGATMLRLGVGGDGATAADLGMIAPINAIDAVVRLLDVLARRGRQARARDIVAAESVAPFRAAFPAWPTKYGGRNMGTPAEPIGAQRLKDGSLAYGIGLAFGHADAAALERLAEAAKAVGARGVRPAPGRTLMIIGLGDEACSAFVMRAEDLGFIVRGDDPRRRVVACAGAPRCASAFIAARAVAPLVAQTVTPLLDGEATIHISGCAKGCAHPAPAALTAVGTPQGCALIANGAARDVAFATVATDQLAAAMARYVGERKREGRHA